MARQHNRVHRRVMLREMRLIGGLIGSLGLIFSPLLLMDLFIITLPLNLEEEFCTSLSIEYYVISLPSGVIE